MLQESGVPATLAVRELVDLFRSYYPAPLSVGQALELAGLERLAGARAATLSGGERQRLYFALAVCGDPEALFLDEPTVGMDVQSRHAFLDRMRTLAAAGRTIVLTTHYLDDADQLAGRVVMIDHGIVIADGSPREIKARVMCKRICFTAPRPMAAALADLPVTEVEVAGSRVRLLSSEPEKVLQVLFERRVALRDLEVAGADLEEAFLALTGPREGQS